MQNPENGVGILPAQICHVNAANLSCAWVLQKQTYAFTKETGFLAESVHCDRVFSKKSGF
ncbi:MAG: hypothetical protein JGK08_12660 [Microcoleus sp. PH2017_04_SCI_O_A]|nr:hypothetical protein [Microcoleus sp. PH2017_04_SCI_O_A]